MSFDGRLGRAAGQQIIFCSLAMIRFHRRDSEQERSSDLWTSGFPESIISVWSFKGLLISIMLMISQADSCVLLKRAIWHPLFISDLQNTVRSCSSCRNPDSSPDSSHIVVVRMMFGEAFSPHSFSNIDRYLICVAPILLSEILWKNRIPVNVVRRLYLSKEAVSRRRLLSLQIFYVSASQFAMYLGISQSVLQLSSNPEVSTKITLRPLRSGCEQVIALISGAHGSKPW